MARPTLREGIEALAMVQWRRENRAIMDSFTEFKKQYALDKAELQRQMNVHRDQTASLADQIKEIKDSSVMRKELEAAKSEESARVERNKFFASGVMGEQEKVMAEQNIAARAKRQRERERELSVSLSVSPITPNPSRIVSTHIPATKPFRTHFFAHNPVYNNENRPGSKFRVTPKSASELQAVISRSSQGSSGVGRDDDSNEEEDDDLDTFNVARMTELPKGPPQRSAWGENPTTTGKRGDGSEPHIQGRSRIVLSEPSDGRPSKIVVFGANPRTDRQLSANLGNLGSKHQHKWPHGASSLANGGLRTTGYVVEQEGIEVNDSHQAKRARIAAPERSYEHQPHARNTIYENPIRPVRTKKIPSKPTPKLPRLVQGKTPLARYYKDSNKAFSTYENKEQEGQYDFVNHFLTGIHLKKHRDQAIGELQQAQESTIRNGRPWILCNWSDVLSSLIAVKLLRREDVV